MQNHLEGACTTLSKGSKEKDTLFKIYFKHTNTLLNIQNGELLLV